MEWFLPYLMGVTKISGSLPRDGLNICNEGEKRVSENPLLEVLLSVGFIFTSGLCFYKRTDRKLLLYTPSEVRAMIGYPYKLSTLP